MIKTGQLFITVSALCNNHYIILKFGICDKILFFLNFWGGRRPLNPPIHHECAPAYYGWIVKMLFVLDKNHCYPS